MLFSLLLIFQADPLQAWPNTPKMDSIEASTAKTSPNVIHQKTQAARTLDRVSGPFVKPSTLLGTDGQRPLVQRLRPRVVARRRQAVA